MNKMEDEAMDLQKLTFFTEGNTFTGSKTKDWDTGLLMRYLIRPDKENDTLQAFIWTADVCFEKAKSTHNDEFPLSDEGLDQIQKWLQQEFDSL